MHLRDHARVIALKINPITLDPTILIIIIEVITQLINMFNNCESKESIKSRLQNPGFFTNIIARRIIRNKLSTYNLDRNLDNKVMTEIFDYAKELHDSEIDEVFKEVGV